MGLFDFLKPREADEGAREPDAVAMNRHLQRAWYHNFELTDAVRPSYDLTVLPQQGFRFDREERVISASVTAEEIFRVFREAVVLLGDPVDVVLERSTELDHEHRDYHRECIDAVVLQSALVDFEEFLTHDCYTGITVLKDDTSAKVQFDEHKLLILSCGIPSIRAELLGVLSRHGLSQKDDIKFIDQAEHHHGCIDYNDSKEQFGHLCALLHVDREN